MLIGISTTMITSCHKDSTAAPATTTPAPVANGNVYFWYNTTGTTATVIINGQNEYITTHYTSDPGCGASGDANFSLPPGSYSYTASSSFSNWSGTVTVTSNGCNGVLL